MIDLFGFESFSDEHCKFLIEQGVVEKLLVLMKPVYGEAKCTLEHAALSALRNLAIPGNIEPSHEKTVTAQLISAFVIASC